MLTLLTRPQALVLEVVRRRADLGEPGPTYRDLCAEFGWSSTGTARDHLRALARKGYVDLPGGRARNVRLREVLPGVTRVPLVGRIAAGTPESAEEEVEQVVPIPADWARRGTHFVLRVKGDSMIGAGILEGDLVVIRQQATGSDGEIVAALIDGETTLKRFRLRGKTARLEAENSRYQPIVIRGENASIQGVLVGLLRDYGSRQTGKSRA